MQRRDWILMRRLAVAVAAFDCWVFLLLWVGGVW